MENKKLEEWSSDDVNKWLGEEMKKFLNEIKLESLSRLNSKQFFRLNEQQIFDVYTNKSSNEDSRHEALIALFNAMQFLKERQSRIPSPMSKSNQIFMKEGKMNLNF